MDTITTRQRFRTILNGQVCVHPISVFDAISARIAEDLGFEVGMLAGSVASLAVLGAPDIVVLTLSEFVEQARRICRASNLPILVDADHGYGNAFNVVRTVEELESSGVTALTVEDTLLPQRFGEDGPKLISIEEGVGKMKAAIQARQDKNLVIIGRTSAVAKSSLEDAIARAKAYEKVGVDAIFLAGITTSEQLDAVSAAISLPLILGSVPASMLPVMTDAEFLRERRVRLSLRGHQPMMAAIEAVYQTMRQIRDGALPRTLPNLAPPERISQVTRADEVKRRLSEFLGRT
jgi:carboxyvinyl-carboxyphosphonate phosphorylmutase